jgi:hypothetical protein
MAKKRRKRTYSVIESYPPTVVIQANGHAAGKVSVKGVSEEVASNHNLYLSKTFLASVMEVIFTVEKGARGVAKGVILFSGSVTTPADTSKPPKNAEYLAYLLLPKAHREVLLGDLVEEYPTVVAKFGARRAKLNFYVHVVFSILPLVRNTLMKWGAVGWVVELIRRISL